MKTMNIFISISTFILWEVSIFSPELWMNPLLSFGIGWVVGSLLYKSIRED